MDFLNFAQEREVYERWLTLYPLMESGIMKYISFKEYKEKLVEKAKTKIKNDNLTDEQIMNHGLAIVAAYEKNQQKAGEKNGNI